MRIAIFLALLAFLPMTFSATARAEEALPVAEEAPAGAEARLAALLQTLEELQKAIQAIDDRLEELEKAMDREERGQPARSSRKPAKKKPEPKDEEGEAKDEKPTEEGGEDAASDEGDEEASEAEGDEESSEEPEEPGIDPAILEVAGRYEIDIDALVEAMVAAMQEESGGELPPEFLDMFVEQFRSQLEDSSLVFEFKVDLPWSVQGTMAGEEQDAGGTWSREGDELTLEQTFENGEAKEEPETMKGTFENGVIELIPDEEAGVPFAIVLRKVD